MVGVGTIEADNPSLTTRLKNRKVKNPLRIILDTHLRTPIEARILNDEFPEKTLLVVGEKETGEKLEQIRDKGISILPCPTREGRLDLQKLMAELGRLTIMSLLVEGGAAVLGSMIREELVDKFHLFKAPKLLGGNDGVPMASGPGARYMKDCTILENLEFRRFGEDMLVTGYPVYRKGGDR
jgi:diaminohydroxyphosphoribosylaminopyrimidine deaminase/5-amino-6-(5-phosphoribosylamino)uracil reductase